MNISWEKIISRVLADLDESLETVEDEIEYGSSSFDLRSLITMLIPEAAREVLVVDDLSQLREWCPLEGVVKRVVVGGREKRILPLPQDFMRLVYIRMSDWSDAVTKVLNPESDSVRLRRYWECRGRECRRRSPAVTSGFYEGERVLEILGSIDGSRPAEGGYLPCPRRDEAGNLVFPSSLEPRLIERIVRKIKEIRK